MQRLLISWIGITDLRAAADSSVGLGPLAQAVGVREFDVIWLLSDHSLSATKPYLRWLQGQTKVPIHLLEERLSSPTEFAEIYKAGVRACERALEAAEPPITLTFHLSPGTPAMAAVWIILGKTRFPGELIESSKEHGVRTASVPFEIAVDFIPDLLAGPDQRLREASAAPPKEAPEFADITFRSQVMRRVIDQARRVAPRNVPVLIEGESGTGKELLARAIHRASPRREEPLRVVNCGAIPPELVESELFGHVKGAFTGAMADRKGLFEEAHGGTLFLDEVGDLPLAAQVKLLRPLQEGEVVRVGSAKPVKVDVRLIAATNRTLVDEVAAGRFREDLFYRLAVAVLKLPPLRDRMGDVSMLLDRLLDQINAESATEPGFVRKELSAGAKKILLAHPWPGNIRELRNTLKRAAIWSPGVSITADDARAALLPTARARSEEILNRPLGNGFQLPELLDAVSYHYLSRAMDEARGNKTRAAELIGLPSYQTLTNWLKRHALER